MKRRVIFAGVAAILSLSLLLPSMAGRIFDRNSAAAQTLYQAEPAVFDQLSYWDFYDRLEHADLFMTQTDIQAGHQHMTEEAATQAAFQAAEAMEQAGMIDSSPKTMEVTLLSPRLLSAKVFHYQKGTIISRIFYGWYCAFADGAGGQLELLLDDKSGNLLAMAYRAGSGHSLTQVQAQETARRAAAFCQGYYGLELLELLPADAKEEGAYAFTLYLEREGKASLALSLVVRADGLGLQ